MTLQEAAQLYKTCMERGQECRENCPLDSDVVLAPEDQAGCYRPALHFTINASMCCLFFDIARKLQGETVPAWSTNPKGKKVVRQ